MAYKHDQFQQLIYSVTIVCMQNVTDSDDPVSMASDHSSQDC